ncbi:MAG: glycosyltransferase family 4 protein [Deltaproteobacteria bacterium]|nr:glycosyltransferase family 4 protein [Deltaproteobacteria bacterium]
MNKDLLDDRYGRFREIPLALGQKGHKVLGLCLSYAKRNEGYIKDGPVIWKSINATRLKLPGLLRFVVEAQKLAKKSDVIWACSDSFYGIIGYFLSLKYHTPLVFDLYDNFEYYLMAKLPVVKQLYRLVVKKCGAVTCVSQPLSRLVKSYGRQVRLFVIENAVRKDLFKPMDKTICRKKLNLPINKFLVGTAGALTENRGFQYLLSAFDMLKTRYPDLQLALAGPRNIPIPHNKRIHDLGILNLEKVPLLLNALDVAVICNRENDFGRYCFPQKAVEIMACDVPLIAARVGSMKELLTDHPNWLFMPDNALYMAHVLENRIVDRKTEYVPPPTWSNLANRLEQIMLKILNERK